MKLLYHPRGSTKAVSPFDNAILAAATGQSVRLVCPYIGLSYLQRILAQCGDWKLVTDVREWCASAGSREVPPLLAFLGQNTHQVRHLEGVHAKTVIGTRAAYVGSANLTQRGILARTELGVSLAQPELLAELRQWFDGIWTDADPLQAHELVELLAWHEQSKAVGRDDTDRNVPKVGKSALRSVAIQDSSVRERAPQAASQPPTQPARATAASAGLVASVAAQDPVRHASRSPQLVESDAGTVVEAFIDSWATYGFTVEDLRRELMTSGHEMSALEVEYTLQRYRANHPATVFEPDTVNRLVFVSGAYRQTTAERFKQDVHRFEVYLMALIDAMDFRESRAVPLFEGLQESGAFTAAELAPLPAQLVRAGLLQQEAMGVHLNPAWEWKGRFQVYEQARARWAQKQARGRFAQAPTVVAAMRPAAVVPELGRAPLEPQRDTDALVQAIMAATARQPVDAEPETSPEPVMDAEVVPVAPAGPELESHALRNHTIAGWMDRKLSDQDLDNIYSIILEYLVLKKLKFSSPKDLAYHLGVRLRLQPNLIESSFSSNGIQGKPIFRMATWNNRLSIQVNEKACDGSRFPRTKGWFTRMNAEIGSIEIKRKAKFIGAYRVTADEAKKQMQTRGSYGIAPFGLLKNSPVDLERARQRASILKQLNDVENLQADKKKKNMLRRLLQVKLSVLKRRVVMGKS